MAQKHIVRRVAENGSPPIPTEYHAVLQRVYGTRGLGSLVELDYSLPRLIPPNQLLGMDSAVSLLIEQIIQGGHILILGDFDADGATSCALAMRALCSLGAKKVSYLVPNRFEFGYGLSPEIVDLASARAPDLLVTVDNGIASHEGVQRAKDLAIPVLITDHHLAGDTLPAAQAIVNPNQPGDQFPSKFLAGVGVTFYLMLGLRRALRESGWFSRQHIKEPNLAELLDLVALGTVADVVQLDHNNRILVEQGLQRIRAGCCCPGISAMLQLAGRSREGAVASDLGFAVGPRLNAAGRLQDISLGIECLLADTMQSAMEKAQQLDTLNRERRTIESEMKQQAEQILARLSLGKSLPMGLCLYDEGWHQGVIGILAARLREGYNRPVVAFAAADSDTLKGSARSVSGLHIRDLLDAIAKRHPKLIQKFGGHSMAAGLALSRRGFEDFSIAFDDEVRSQLGADGLKDELITDGELAPRELSLETAQALRQGGPWGQGFPEPLFDGEFKVVQQRIVGAGHLKMTLRHSTEDSCLMDAIAFNQAPVNDHKTVRLAYRLDVNEFRGMINPQMVVEYIE